MDFLCDPLNLTLCPFFQRILIVCYFQFEREQDVFGLGDLFQQVKNKRGGEREGDREDSKRTRH